MSQTTLRPETLSTNPSVLMFTAPNPGPKTLQGTHTFVVGRSEAYILDPGPDFPPYQEALARWLRANAVGVRGILLSHGHPDHAPGAKLLKQLLSASVWAPDRMHSREANVLNVHRRFGDGDEFPVDGDVLQAVATPGHTYDHAVFWLKGARILFSADLILGAGTTLVAPPEGDMAQYMRSLEIVRELHPRLIAPGHGPVIRDPAAKIEEYVEHRRRREDQILEALAHSPATAEEIVRRVYSDLNPELHGLAEGSVRAQLSKLAQEGKVRRAGERYSLRS